MNDNVNHPQHYTLGKYETIEIIKDTLSPVQYQGFLYGNIMKYIIRHPHKNAPITDLNKAKFYIDKLIDTYQED